MPDLSRCPWAESDPLSRVYHDTQWGRPCHDERELFKMLILEGQQAGLAWLTILRKLEGLQKAYDDFDPVKIASYDQGKIASLLSDPLIIRNRLKVQATIDNAQAYLRLRDQGTSLNEFLWAYVEGSPIVNNWRAQSELPAKTALSERLSRDLQKLGFKFVGPTIIYAFAQAVGLVNDHLVSCPFRGVSSETE
ncbi:MAG: DNA-3-methyladenine glycosylase I [Deltaproteobacteria bacterium]|jgi:DNA-3-methyladenine glycosylase I|nr:DNA-3-methyladenine glycosylase I [Deltaproteobacteria bacterium]